jgi:hypothetical protein
MQEFAVARLVKAGILPQQRWKNGRGERTIVFGEEHKHLSR